MVGSRLQEGARNLAGGQACEQLQRECDLRIRRQHRMAGGEDQPQHVVIDVVLVIQRLGKVRRVMLAACIDVGSEFLLPAPVQGSLTNAIQRLVAGGGHEPGGRILWQPRIRPVFERRHQCILCQFLGQAHIAHDAGHRRDDARRLDAPDGIDGAGKVSAWHRAAARAGVPPAHAARG